MDSETLRRARDGDRQASRVLGAWLYRELLDYFVGGASPDERVSELIQKAVIDVLEDLAIAPLDIDLFRDHVHSYAGMELLTDQRDRARERRRAELRAELGPAPAGSASGTVVRPLIDEEQRQLVRVHVDRLPIVYRNALWHVLDGGDYKSLAVHEGIRDTTAASRISYAIKLLECSIEAERRTEPRYRTHPPSA